VDVNATKRWLVPPGEPVKLSKYDPEDTAPFHSKEGAEQATEKLLDRLLELHEQLHVDGRFAVLLVLQGMDTAGKDGTINHLSRGLNLLGAEVTAFKAPTEAELKHDFLWRIHQRTPERGRLGIFNRSQYEDVLVVRVHNLVPPSVWQKRYDQINEFEELLVESGTLVLKCFLHISKDEQRERLQARLDDPSKVWKFNANDIKERALWDDYQKAYEVALSRCSTKRAPWYIIPSNKKWFRNYAVVHLLVELLESLDLKLPTPEFDPRTIRVE
jgi:PPK2 family polyphosphate:nucleotide phosphotransferase